MISYPRDIHVTHGISVPHGIQQIIPWVHVTHGICYPVGNTQLSPTGYTHGIEMTPTGYTHGIYWFLSRGCYPVGINSYPVDDVIPWVSWVIPWVQPRFTDVTYPSPLHSTVYPHLDHTSGSGSCVSGWGSVPHLVPLITTEII